MRLQLINQNIPASNTVHIEEHNNMSAYELFFSNCRATNSSDAPPDRIHPHFSGQTQTR